MSFYIRKEIYNTRDAPTGLAGYIRNQASLTTGSNLPIYYAVRTYIGGVTTLIADPEVSSVTRVATGRYRFTMTNAFQSTYPSIIVSPAATSAGGNDTAWTIKIMALASTTFDVETVYDNGSARGYFDTLMITVLIYDY